jgi:two-component system phosphate regulon sensor histidine kinase PhoR
MNNAAKTKCSLVVKDTGIGISKADQKKIGNRFFRSNTGRNPATTPRGSGLGLSIVLNIIESLRGAFQLESELGQGTSITIELPTENANPAPAGGQTTKAMSMKKPW